MPYPESAGYKRDGTSQVAANTTDASTLRSMALQSVKAGPKTADQVAEHLGIDRLAIRPRLTELQSHGLVRDSGKRAANASGKMAIVWEAVPVSVMPAKAGFLFETERDGASL